MMRAENQGKKIAPSVPSHPNQYAYSKQPQTSMFLVTGCAVYPQIHIRRSRPNTQYLNVIVSEDIFMPEQDIFGGRVLRWQSE